MSTLEDGEVDLGRSLERTRLARSRTTLSVLVGLLSTVHVVGSVERHRGVWSGVVTVTLVAMLAARSSAAARGRRDGGAALATALCVAVLLTVVAIS